MKLVSDHYNEFDHQVRRNQEIMAVSILFYLLLQGQDDDLKKLTRQMMLTLLDQPNQVEGKQCSFLSTDL
jgi:hypothetical protein